MGGDPLTPKRGRGRYWRSPLPPPYRFKRSRPLVSTIAHVIHKIISSYPQFLLDSKCVVGWSLGMLNEELSSRLTVKQRRFVDAYLGEAMGNVTKAAEIAGYSNGLTGHGWACAGSGVMKNLVVRAAIADAAMEASARADLTVDKVLAGIEKGVLAAWEKGDLAAYARFLEMQGRYLAMFTDRSQVEDVTEVRRLSEKERLENVRLANIRLSELG